MLPYAAKQYSKKKPLKLDVTLNYVINKLIHLNKFGDEDTKFVLMFGIKLCPTPMDFAYSGKARETS